MPRSILLIEKDSVARSAMIEALESMDYRVVGIENPSIAYDVLDAIKFRVLIVNLEAVDPDGVQISIAARSYQHDLRVIVVAERDVAGMVSPFIDAIIHRPFSAIEIDEVIQRVVFAEPA